MANNQCQTDLREKTPEELEAEEIERQDLALDEMVADGSVYESDYATSEYELISNASSYEDEDDDSEQESDPNFDYIYAATHIEELALKYTDAHQTRDDVRYRMFKYAVVGSLPVIDDNRDDDADDEYADDDNEEDADEDIENDEKLMLSALVEESASILERLNL